MDCVPLRRGGLRGCARYGHGARCVAAAPDTGRRVRLHSQEASCSKFAPCTERSLEQCGCRWNTDWPDRCRWGFVKRYFCRAKTRLQPNLAATVANLTFAYMTLTGLQWFALRFITDYDVIIA